MFMTILGLATVATLSVISRRSDAAYRLRLKDSDLNDWNVVQARFRELVTNVFPLLFLGALPIAIIGDFIPRKIRGVLNGTKSGKFRTCPLHALVLRLNFFNHVLVAPTQSVFENWFKKLTAIHENVGIKFTSEKLAEHHRGVLGGVLTAVETLEPYLAWRKITAEEYEVIYRWLACVAKNLGIVDFPKSLDALRTTLANYEEKHYATNQKDSAAEAAQLFRTMTHGITRLFPLVGSVLEPVIRALLVAAMSVTYRQGFGLSMSATKRYALGTALFPIYALLVFAGLLFPFLGIPVNFGLIVRYANSRAEQSVTY